jgi:hypothetical protein
MSDSEPDCQRMAAAHLTLVKGMAADWREKKPPLASSQRDAPPIVAFDRSELRIIFDLYGPRVANGDWRDYALDFTSSKAIFSIFRRTCETPLYRIEKNPLLARRQGAYSVIDASSGIILRRGHDLARVVGVLNRNFRLVGAE